MVGIQSDFAYSLRVRSIPRSSVAFSVALLLVGRKYVGTQGSGGSFRGHSYACEPRVE